MLKDTLDILLATHNGEAFVDEQIYSLIAQRQAAFRIFIRDDGSTDRTPAILKSLAERFPEYIGGLEISKNRKGPLRGYASLLRQSRAEYIMFCDQDDVWLPDKIQLTLARMKRLEGKRGRKTPILVHTDMAVVDAALKPIYPSFLGCQSLNPRHNSTNRLLVQNIITGCTMMINRALKERVGPIPEDVRMHDWWIGLVASLFGRIDYIPRPTVLYRQHHQNHVGVKPLTLETIQSRLLNMREVRTDWEKNAVQAGKLLGRYGHEMRPYHARMCRDFVSLSKETHLKRWRHIFQHRFFKHGLIRNFGLPLVFRQ